MLHAGSALAYGSCVNCYSCCLRECYGIRLSLRSLHPVAGTGVDTVRVVLDKVVDIVVEIRVSLPVLTTVAILLIQILVCRFL
jgi:hypothetical protein